MREREGARGYKPVRQFYEMKRELELSAPDLSLPDGFQIRPVLREHVRLIW
jgi:hypothetical protein